MDTMIEPMAPVVAPAVPAEDLAAQALEILGSAPGNLPENASIGAEGRNVIRSMMRAAGCRGAWVSGLSIAQCIEWYNANIPTRERLAAAWRAAAGQPAAPAPKPGMGEPLNGHPAAAGSADVLAEALRKVIAEAAASTPVVVPLDEARVIALVKEHAPKPEVQLVAVQVTKADGEVVTSKPALRHECFEPLLQAVNAGVYVYLVGPAGSGKTTIARQVAEALGLSFWFNGALASEYKVTGFVDAQGRYVSTAFRQAYEHGGLYLFDEIDGSMPGALLALNGALANGHMDFPDKSIPCHPNFRCIAAANTFGHGATRDYVGRNQLDGSTLDRFVPLAMDYDERMERAIAPNAEWTARVQAVRAATRRTNIKRIISPRASINGAKLLAAGWTRAMVEDSLLFSGLDSDTLRRLKAAAAERSAA